MYGEMSKEELITAFEEYIGSEDIKKNVEASKMLGYLGIDSIKKNSDNILKLTLVNDISVKLNLMTAFSSILNKFPEVFSEFLACIYYNSEFSNNILSQHAKEVIITLNPDVIERHVEYYKNNIYSKNKNDRVIAIIGLSLISRYNPEFLEDLLSEVVMVSTYDNLQIMQLIALGTLDDFSDFDKNCLKYAYLVFGKKLEVPPLELAKDHAEICKSLISLSISDDLDEKTLFKLLQYLTSDNEFYALLSAIALENNMPKLKEFFKLHPSVVSSQFSEFYKKYMNKTSQLVSSYLVLKMAHSLESSLFEIDDEKIIYFVIKNLSEKNKHLQKAYSLKNIYYLSLFNSEKINKNIIEVFDKIPLNTIMGEHPLCYYFGMPLLINLFNKTPKVDESPYLIRNLDKRFVLMSPMEKYEYFKKVERNLNSLYWLDRYEGAKKLGTILYAYKSTEFLSNDKIPKILSDSVYLNRNLGAWILRIMVDLDVKIPENMIMESVYNIKNPYWELRVEYGLLFYELISKYPEILTDIKTATKIQSELNSQCIIEPCIISKEIIKNTLKLISKHLKHEYEDFHVEKFDIENIESFKINPNLHGAELENLKIMLDKYILKSDAENIKKVLKFIETYESAIDCTYLLEELLKLKDSEETAAYLLNNLKNKSKIIPTSREVQIFNNLNQDILEYNINAMEEILVYLNEGFELDEKIISKIKEISVMSRDEKVTRLCLDILGLQKDIESKRIILEKNELDMHLNDLKSIKEKYSKNLKDMSSEELYLKLSYFIHKKSIYLEENINFKDILYFLSDYSKKPSVILTTMILKILKNVVVNSNPRTLNQLNIENPEILNNLYYLVLLTDYPMLSNNAILLTAEIVRNKPKWLLENMKNTIETKDWLSFFSRLLEYPDTVIIGETLDAIDYYIKNSKYCKNCENMPEKLLESLNDSNWANFKKIINVLTNYDMEDPKILNYVSEILIKKIENSNDDSKLSLLRFFKIKNITNLDESLYNRLLVLEKSENFYIKEDIEKIKSNRNN